MGLIGPWDVDRVVLHWISSKLNDRLNIRIVKFEKPYYVFIFKLKIVLGK